VISWGSISPIDAAAGEEDFGCERCAAAVRVRGGLVSVSVKILFETHTTQLVRALDQTSLKFHRATWIAGH
jgi:hypothetical protein